MVDPSDDDVVALARAAGCTDAQISVLQAIGADCTIAEIAAWHGTSRQCVEKMRSRAYKRISKHLSLETT